MKFASSPALTTIVIVSTLPQEPEIVYVITWLPTPAVVGLNVPVVPFVIPIPVHVPPGLTAVKLTLDAFEQNGPAWVIVASVVFVMEILNVAVPGHVPGVVYVTTYEPTPLEFRLIIPVLAFITPLLLIVNVPPLTPVIVGVGFGSLKQ